uniref:EF-hand domain-containing protein n=1 Tax=Panagrolaimus sp. JU765 TaxID=591449 RepID=A0AC34RA46_9BILA
MKQLKDLFFTPNDLDKDGKWSRQEYLRVNNMYFSPVANVFEKYPMVVEDVYDALFGFPLIQTIETFYEADRNKDGTLSTSEFIAYLNVANLKTDNAASFVQESGGNVNFTQFLALTNSFPNDLFPKNTENYDNWGNAVAIDYSHGNYLY